jgi:hypothetical protein
MSGASEIYHRDFHAWAMRNAELIRQGRLAEIDGEHVAEELESMGKSQQRALGSRLTVLLAHLLKWRHQPGGHGASWRNTITLQRIELEELLEENPSLRPMLPAVAPGAYRKARLWAANETQLDLGTFPTGCPFGLEEMLDEDFWPD